LVVPQQPTHRRNRGEGVGTYVVSEYADEPLISDQLVSEFGIVVEDPARGLWRLKGESVIRSSER
jgi:hypothetical protein